MGDDSIIQGDPAEGDVVERPPDAAQDAVGVPVASGEVLEAGEDETQGATDDPSGPIGSD